MQTVPPFFTFIHDPTMHNHEWNDDDSVSNQWLLFQSNDYQFNFNIIINHYEMNELKLNEWLWMTEWLSQVNQFYEWIN